MPSSITWRVSTHLERREPGACSSIDKLVSTSNSTMAGASSVPASCPAHTSEGSRPSVPVSSGLKISPVLPLGNGLSLGSTGVAGFLSSEEQAPKLNGRQRHRGKQRRRPTQIG